MGEAEIDKAPVELYPAERVRHGWRTPDLPAEQDSGAQQGLLQRLLSPPDYRRGPGDAWPCLRA